jgi:hypothetical protein
MVQPRGPLRFDEADPDLGRLRDVADGDQFFHDLDV